MELGFLQYAPQERSLIENVDFIVSSTKNLSSSLIVLPELFLGSYTKFTAIREKTLLSLLKPLLNHSLNRDLAFVGTLPIQVGELVFNRSIYIYKGKIVGKYDKRNLFGSEQDVFTPGSTPYELFNFSHLKFAVQICFDNVDPTVVHDATRRHGIDLLVAPASVSVTFIRDILKARSLENQIMSIFCNRVGNDNGVYYSGNSSIFFPDSRELSARFSTDSRFIPVSKKELGEIVSKRQSFFVARR